MSFESDLHLSKPAASHLPAVDVAGLVGVLMWHPCKNKQSELAAVAIKVLARSRTV